MIELTFLIELMLIRQANQEWGKTTSVRHVCKTSVIIATIGNF